MYSSKIRSVAAACRKMKPWPHDHIVKSMSEGRHIATLTSKTTYDVDSPIWWCKKIRPLATVNQKKTKYFTR